MASHATYVPPSFVPFQCVPSESNQIISANCSKLIVTARKKYRKPPWRFVMRCAIKWFNYPSIGCAYQWPFLNATLCDGVEFRINLAINTSSAGCQIVKIVSRVTWSESVLNHFVVNRPNDPLERASADCACRDNSGWRGRPEILLIWISWRRCSRSSSRGTRVKLTPHLVTLCYFYSAELDIVLVTLEKYRKPN